MSYPHWEVEDILHGQNCFTNGMTGDFPDMYAYMTIMDFAKVEEVIKSINDKYSLDDWKFMIKEWKFAGYNSAMPALLSKLVQKVIFGSETGGSKPLTE